MKPGKDKISNYELVDRLFPWRYRYAKLKLPIEHPRNMREYGSWPKHSEAEQNYFNLLSFMTKAIRLKKPTSWHSVYAIGPFVGEKSRFDSIHFLVVVKSGNTFMHIESLSNRLVDAYLEWNILPLFHVMSLKSFANLKRNFPKSFKDTLNISIRVI